MLPEKIGNPISCSLWGCLDIIVLFSTMPANLDPISYETPVEVLSNDITGVIWLDMSIMCSQG